ncbi:S8 family serine peptidase [Nonomuraea sp. NPDC050783]|uniref:S8 family serine peptidase n=1 Tax=Nonomuraea sp. NPDC050783 TaxID=3154634 RepID=UPI0034656619
MPLLVTTTTEETRLFTANGKAAITGSVVLLSTDESGGRLRVVPNDAVPLLEAGLLDGLRKVSLDGPGKVSLDTSVPQIGASVDRAGGLTGKGVKVAVLDTGIDATHADPVDRVSGGKDFTDEPDERDPVGHGTHVASTIAGSGAASDGRYRGVAAAPPHGRNATRSPPRSRAGQVAGPARRCSTSWGSSDHVTATRPRTSSSVDPYGSGSRRSSHADGRGTATGSHASMPPPVRRRDLLQQFLGQPGRGPPDLLPRGRVGRRGEPQAQASILPSGGGPGQGVADATTREDAWRRRTTGRALDRTRPGAQWWAQRWTQRWTQRWAQG